jgi:hypothetical protein
MIASIAELNRYLVKFISVVIGFSRISAFTFVAGCSALALSRICQVLAFFLPLKIFILFHSREVPAYFDVFPEFMQFSDVIVFLSVMVPVAYLVFIVLGIVYRRLIDLHLKHFTSSALLIMGKEVKEKNKERLHNHVSKAFSEVGVIIISLVVATLLDYVLGLIWVSLLYFNLWLFHSKAFGAKDNDRLTFLKLHRRQFIEYISSANFMLVFAALAIELAYFDLSIYSAIFLLLLSRIVFQALNRFSVESLYILKFLP